MDSITIYERKNKNTIYVTRHHSGNPPTYTQSDKDIKAFRRDYVYLWDMYLSNRITFEDITSKSLFEKLFQGQVLTCPFLFAMIFRRKTSVRGTRTARWERGIIMIQCA